MTDPKNPFGDMWTGMRSDPFRGEVVLYGAPPPSPWDREIRPFPPVVLPPGVDPDPQEEKRRKFIDQLLDEQKAKKPPEPAIVPPPADMDLRMRELIDEIRCFRHAMEKALATHYGVGATEVGMTVGEMSSGELELKLDIDGVTGSTFLSREMWEELGKIAGWTTGKKKKKGRR